MNTASGYGGHRHNDKFVAYNASKKCSAELAFSTQDGEIPQNPEVFSDWVGPVQHG